MLIGEIYGMEEKEMASWVKRGIGLKSSGEGERIEPGLAEA